VINVSEFTKKVYSEMNVPKYLTVSFPNDNIPDITNENIYGESMKLTQSICEDNILSFGGCNASQFELTVMDIQQDLSDKDIMVTMSLKDPGYVGEFVNGKNYSENEVVLIENEYYRFLQDFGRILNISELSRTVSSQTIRYTSGTFYTNEVSHLMFSRTTNFQATITLIEYYPNNVSVVDGILIASGNEAEIRNDYIVFSRLPAIDDDMLSFENQTRTRNFSWIGNELLINVGDDISKFKFSVKIETQYRERFERSKIYLTPNNIEDYLETQNDYIDTSETDDIVLFRGRIISAKKQKDKRLKDILAYDSFYDYSSVDVIAWMENNSYLDYHYRGAWSRDVLYAEDDIVKFVIQTQSGPRVDYYRCLSDAAPMNVPPSSGSVNWEYCSEASINVVTIGDMMDELATDIGTEIDITETPTPTLVMQNCKAVFKKQDTQYAATRLMYEYFNNNSLNGYINPVTGKIDGRNLNRIFTADSNYVGKWNTLRHFSAGEIVSYKNTYGSVYFYYKAKVGSDAIVPENEDYWEKMPALYYPDDGHFNYSELYDYDSLDYQDYDYECTGRCLFDADGNAIKGSMSDTNVRIEEGMLLTAAELNSVVIWPDLVNPSTPPLNIAFTPTRMNAVGLPFVQPGDWISYDVEEYNPDTDSGIVKNKKTVILSRVLSGINALTDEIEARYE